MHDRLKITNTHFLMPGLSYKSIIKALSGLHYRMMVVVHASGKCDKFHLERHEQRNNKMMCSAFHYKSVAQARDNTSLV